MSSLGAYLKEMRNKCHLSLKDVQEQCGVTDSKLSRLERGEGKTLAPYELKKLAQLYGIGVVPLYIMAGYLDKSDLSAYQLMKSNRANTFPFALPDRNGLPAQRRSARPIRKKR